MRLTTAKKMLLLRRRAVPTRAERILSLSPVGYWRLDDGSGVVAADSSGNGQDGSISGASWGVQTGTDGTPALYFDGVNDFVIMAESATLEPASAVSVSLWVRAATGAGCVMCVDDGDWSYAYGGFGFPSFQVQNGSSVSTGGTFTADTWQHWLWTYSAASGDLNAYRDGVLVDTGSGAASNISYTAGLQLRVGRRVGHSWFAGALQHVAIFGTELTAADAVELAI